MEYLKFSRRLGTLLVCAVMSGCSLNLDPAPSLGALNIGGRDVNYVSPRQVGGPDSGPITRMFGGTCIFGATEESATLAALAPIALNFAVDTLGKLLQRAGEERAVAVYAGMRTKVAAAPTGPGAQEGDELGAGVAAPTVQVEPIKCVQFVHGEFVGAAAEASSPDWLSSIADKTNTRVETLKEALAERGIFLSGEPAFFMEAQVVRTKDGAYALRPNVINYDLTIDTGLAGTSRGLFFEFGINHGALSLTGENPSKGILAIGKMEPGGEAIYFADRDPRTPVMLWTVAPGGSATLDQAQNLEGRLVEVRDARPILAAIGDILAGEGGDQLASALRQDLFPTPAEEAAKVTAQIAALGQFQTAVAAYRAAIDARVKALAEAEGEPNFSLVKGEQDAAVQAARLAVVLAAQQAGVPAPAF